jgi:hypothetical protein
MDRPIVYPGALPQDTDLLTGFKATMMADGFLAQAILGTATAVDGCTATQTPVTPDLHVHVSNGSIYQIDTVDQSAYGSLGTDVTTVYKQGINSAADTVFTITPPGTAGQSQVYLIQAEIQDLDAGSTVLSYYNAGNPASPFAGPANAGTSQNTLRKANCLLSLKAGTAATTGSQTTPAPDAGFVGLWAVTVANGQTQILNANIVAYTASPIIPIKLPQVPAGVQDGRWLYGTDTGAVNALVAKVTPVPSVLTLGMTVHIKVAATNTGASTLNLNGLGTVAIHRAGGAALSAGDLLIGQVASLVYDGSFWQTANYLGTAGANTNNFNNVNMPYALDTSTSSNTITVSPTPAMPGTISAGQVLIVKLANPITGATTIACSGVTGSPFPVISFTGQPLTYGAAGTNEMLWMLYDGTNFQIVNPPQPLQQNLTIFVSASIGLDTLDGSQATVSGTKGPLRHIQAAVNKAFNYSPTQFAITIQVADGTYAESVITPSIPGPAIIVNGNNATPSNVVVSGGGSTSTFLVTGPNTMTVQNLKASNAVVNTAAFGASGSGATLITSNTVSGAVSTWVFLSNGGASVQIGSHAFSGNCSYAFACYRAGTMSLVPSANYTISASITLSAFVNCNSNGVLEVPATGVPTFTNPGNVTGLKYQAYLNGVINTQGAGVNYFPGNSAGTTATGAQYG